ncbi:S1C family serine protease [Christensenellaceae bacterium OttesenSCG-928-K19]|nr:S1C family serine protease [Christensenellaceae bacterium OttesenSCG-928-K19]
MMQFKKTRMLLIFSLFILTLALTSCFGTGTPAQNTEATTAEATANEEASTYTVTFDLNGGTLVSGELEQQVEEGGSATAPQAENDGAELTWDGDFTYVSSNITVTAQWEKKELTSTEVADIVQKGTVSINCEYYNGSTGGGSGFFIDNEGTIVTSYHVIEYAADINVEVPDGGKYDVESVIAFSELNDLAKLKINMQDSPGLTISTDEVKVGEAVYANGSALGTLSGTFTSGTVSSASRDVNGIDCIQMDAAISSGNSGGPLVNSYAEVIGVNAMSYVEGENLNLAVKINNLEDLADNEVNYSVKSYEEWIMKESDRSYSLYDPSLEGTYYSTINTYTSVTGQSCVASVDFDGETYDGYVDGCEYYAYEYVAAEADQYVEYLNSKGFSFDEREEFDEGVSYYYYNDWNGAFVDMFQDHDGYLSIWVYYLY